MSLDLEVGIQDSRIHQFAAVRGETGKALVYQRGDLAAALEKLDTFSQAAAFLLGHNLIAFDLPHLRAANANLRVLEMPAVDTLRLNLWRFRGIRTTTSLNTIRMASSSTVGSMTPN